MCIAGGAVYAVLVMLPTPRPAPVVHLAPLAPPVLCVLAIAPLWRRLIPSFTQPWTLHIEQLSRWTRLRLVLLCWDRSTSIHVPGSDLALRHGRLDETSIQSPQSLASIGVRTPRTPPRPSTPLMSVDTRRYDALD
jgi:hypothetical protein